MTARKQPDGQKFPSTQQEAAEATIAALQGLGRIEPIDTARIAALRGLARAIDADPANAQLWREYRMSEAALRETGTGGDDLDALLKALSSPMGDEPDPKPKVPRKRSGTGRKGAEPAADAVATTGRRRRAGTST